MAILPTLIYRRNAIPIKIPIFFYTELDKLILKFIWKCNGSWIAKRILRRKKNVWGLCTSWLQNLLQSYSHPNSTYWHKHIQSIGVDQWTGWENPEITPHTHQSDLVMGVMTIQWGKDSSFNKWYWETGYLHAKEWSWTLTPLEHVIYKGKN